MKPFSEKRIIRTSLAHPIAFNHDPPDDGSAPCHFCSGPQYGIMGLGFRDVEVVEPANGKGYEEVCGGHRGEGQEASRICVLCTMQRVRICMCIRHEVRPLEHVSPENMDFVTAFESLMSGSEETKDTWCSICPSLAFYECCSPQEVDAFGQPLDPTSAEPAGCGLLLCETCATALEEEHDGNLQTLLHSSYGEDGQMMQSILLP
ncbi:hypothetical protein LTR16_008134 [Cryomyces antarcticus]|uniref:Uncharacterized protein n=1 Tax=Cryomyces antarcticus TaxID=329879 RepID=A0ABR0M3S7_9PEZI|nr:hypothetical protein LTR16_008134 [Cryomyces antarcticus]